MCLDFFWIIDIINIIRGVEIKKKVIYVILGIILGGLLFGLGLFVGKEVLKDDEKVEKEEEVKETVKDENGYPEGFVITGYSSIDDYYIVSGYVSGDDYGDYMYIYDECANLKASFVNASYMEKVTIGDKFAYQVDIALGGGGSHSTTYILNEDLDVIVKTEMLPEQFDGMDEDLFSAYYNSDGTISIMINDIYVYDYEGKLVKTIETNENVIEINRDYYLVKEDGKFKLLRYDNDFELLVEDNENMNLITAPTGGSSGIEFENKKIELSLVENEGTANPVCYSYTFVDSNQKLTLSKKEKIECAAWVYGE